MLMIMTRLGSGLSQPHDRSRRKRFAEVVLVLVIGVSSATVPSLSAAADRLYYFVDENGTAHFSNIPVDKRYRPYLMIVEDTVSAPARGPSERLPLSQIGEDSDVPQSQEALSDADADPGQSVDELMTAEPIKRGRR